MAWVQMFFDEVLDKLQIAFGKTQQRALGAGFCAVLVGGGDVAC